MNSSSVPALAISPRSASRASWRRRICRGEATTSVPSSHCEVGHARMHRALVPRDRPQRVEVGLHLEVAVAALPRRHLVAVDGLHVDVDGEQVVAALGAVLERPRRGSARRSGACPAGAPPCRRSRAARCRPCRPRPPSSARRASRRRDVTRSAGRGSVLGRLGGQPGASSIVDLLRIWPGEVLVRADLPPDRRRARITTPTVTGA